MATLGSKVGTRSMAWLFYKKKEEHINIIAIFSFQQVLVV